MNLLVDTHVLLWWLADDAKLSPEHRKLIVEGSNRVFVSSISVAEMSIKASLGKLSIPDDPADAITASGFEGLVFDSRHALELRTLPWLHRDPFDRMLISQARVDDLAFLTVDPRCREYDVSTR